MDGVLGSETESHVIMDGTVSIFHGERDGVLVGSTAKPEKLIIDTDPGIGEFFSFSPSIKYINKNKLNLFYFKLSNKTLYIYIYIYIYPSINR